MATHYGTRQATGVLTEVKSEYARPRRDYKSPPQEVYEDGETATFLASSGGVFKSAAAEILAKEKRLMTTGELTKVALERGFIKCQGKTPENTMASALYTDVRRKGAKSLFIKPKEGLFGLKAWISEPWLLNWLLEENISMSDLLPDCHPAELSLEGLLSPAVKRPRTAAVKPAACTADQEVKPNRNPSRGRQSLTGCNRTDRAQEDDSDNSKSNLHLLLDAADEIDRETASLSQDSLQPSPRTSAKGPAGAKRQRTSSEHGCAGESQRQPSLATPEDLPEHVVYHPQATHAIAPAVLSAVPQMTVSGAFYSLPYFAQGLTGPYGNSLALTAAAYNSQLGLLPIPSIPAGQYPSKPVAESLDRAQPAHTQPLQQPLKPPVQRADASCPPPLPAPAAAPPQPPSDPKRKELAVEGPSVATAAVAAAAAAAKAMKSMKVKQEVQVEAHKGVVPVAEQHTSSTEVDCDRINQYREQILFLEHTLGTLHPQVGKAYVFFARLLQHEGSNWSLQMAQRALLRAWQILAAMKTQLDPDAPESLDNFSYLMGHIKETQTLQQWQELAAKAAVAAPFLTALPPFMQLQAPATH